jgi:ankyrin repeat protein
MLENLSPNVNSKDHKGWTPLMNAAFNNQIRICKLLLTNEADINLKNNLEMKAFDLARSVEVKELLDEEMRKANLFNFEQMLELEMSLRDSSSFLDGTTTILNSQRTEENEKGNREILQKITRPVKFSHFKKRKSKVIGKHENVLKLNNIPVSYDLLQNDIFSSNNNSQFYVIYSLSISDRWALRPVVKMKITFS